VSVKVSQFTQRLPKLGYFSREGRGGPLTATSDLDPYPWVGTSIFFTVVIQTRSWGLQKNTLLAVRLELAIHRLPIQAFYQLSHPGSGCSKWNGRGGSLTTVA